MTDPQGPASGDWRVRRGGSGSGGPLLRSANRNFAHPASKYNTLGFRLVKGGQVKTRLTTDTSFWRENSSPPGTA